jgi:hypothetical protein
LGKIGREFPVKYALRMCPKRYRKNNTTYYPFKWLCKSGILVLREARYLDGSELKPESIQYTPDWGLVNGGVYDCKRVDRKNSQAALIGEGLRAAPNGSTPPYLDRRSHLYKI